MKLDLDRRTALTLIAAGAALPAPLLASTGKPAKDLVATYAAAWARKDLDAIVACMDADVRFVGPNVKADGRAAYRASTERFLGLVTRVDVRACVHRGNQAMLAYDFVCRDPIGTSPVAELVHIANGRIRSSEIFFDTAPFAAFARAQHS
jgi:ketosteroid isomerase-like protein